MGGPEQALQDMQDLRDEIEDLKEELVTLREENEDQGTLCYVTVYILMVNIFWLFR